MSSDRSFARSEVRSAACFNTAECELPKVSMKWGVPERSCSRHVVAEVSRMSARLDELAKPKHKRDRPHSAGSSVPAEKGTAGARFRLSTSALSCGCLIIKLNNMQFSSRGGRHRSGPFPRDQT